MMRADWSGPLTWPPSRAALVAWVAAAPPMWHAAVVASVVPFVNYALRAVTDAEASWRRLFAVTGDAFDLDAIDAVQRRAGPGWRYNADAVESVLRDYTAGYVLGACDVPPDLVGWFPDTPTL